MHLGRETAAKRLVTAVEHHGGRRDRAGNTSRRLAPVWGVVATLLLAMLLLHLGLASQAWAAPTVTGFRFGTEEHRTRVVLDLNQEVSYRITTETRPDRLVVDLDGVRWQLPPDSIARPRGFVRDHHYGPTGPRQSRLVVETAGPFRVLGNIILPPSRDSARFRLVIDLLALAAAPALPQATTAASDVAPLPAPRFAAASESGLPGEAIVMAVRVGEQARAYPVEVMAYHHVLNDVVGDTPLVVTY